MVSRHSGSVRASVGATFGVALLASGAAFAADIKPAVVYDLGGKFDKSFNEGVFNGATKFKKELGVDFRDLEIQSDAQREQVLRKFAKDGFSPIMTVGFAWATALGKVAGEFPNTKFAIIDWWSTSPTCSRSPSRRTRVRSSSACWRRRPRRPARSASSAAWTFR